MCVVYMLIVDAQAKPLTFPLCQDPFFNSIYNATECDKSISFGQDIPSTNLKNLYIRESYRTIASSINPGINKAIIAGISGVGKSFFLIYLLWKLVKEGQRVLFFYHPFNIYYDGQGGVFMLDKLPSYIHFSFWNDTLWCLFSGKCKNETHLDDLPFELCTFVMSTSPRLETLYDFRKSPVPQEFEIPTWSKAELKRLRRFI